MPKTNKELSKEITKYKEVCRQLKELVSGLESELKEKTDQLEEMAVLSKELKEKTGKLCRLYGLGK